MIRLIKKMINWKGEELITAVENNDLQKVESLIKKGAYINCKNCEFSSPIHIAVKKGSIEMVEILLSLGADIDILHGPVGPEFGPRRGFAPIHFAIFNKNFEMVKFLIINNANMEVRTTYNPGWPYWCPIHFAVSSGVEEIVKILVECGVDINATMNRGAPETRPLQMAINRKKKGEGYDNIITILKSAGVF